MFRKIRMCCTERRCRLLIDQLTKRDKLGLPKASFCTKTNEELHASDAAFPSFNIRSKYSSDEQSKILEVLNTSTAGELARYDISKGRAKNLEVYRRRNGSFEILDHVLMVEGVGIKLLEKFFESIIKGENESTGQGEVKPPRRNIVTSPSLSETKRSVIKTAMGICIGVNNVSWAELDRNGSLLLWDCYDNSELPPKMDLNILLELALIIRQRIPESDVYVIESTSPISQTAQHISNVILNLQRAQLTAILITLLSTKINGSNEYFGASNWEAMNNCYFLRPRSPARLFRIMIGTEKVSAQTIVRHFLDNSIPKELEHISHVDINPSLRHNYEKKRNFEREALSQALLVSAAFMDLAVHRIPLCLKAVGSG